VSESFRVHVGGLKELRRDLRAVDKALPSRVLPAAHRNAAELVLPHARRESPVGQTGRLRDSHRVLASQKRGAVAGGGARTLYGRFLFFGTKVRRHRNGKSVGQIAQNKWLDRALTTVGPNRIVNEFNRALEQELARHGLRPR
jgi:hypothetical protein